MPDNGQKNKSLWGMVAVIFVAYFFVNFHRYAGGVSAPILIKEFSLDPTQVGLFGAVFTYSYAFMNLPAGLIIDKLGSRKVMGVLYIIAALGTVIVAVTSDFTILLIGRAMIALGIAPVYASASKAMAVWVKPEQFSILNGTLLSSGRAGGVLAATPLIFLIGAMGWRNTYYVIAAISLAIGIGAFLLIKEKDAPKVEGKKAANPFKGFGKLVKQPQYLLVVIFMISLNATSVNLFANWGGVLLTKGMNFTKETAANILLMASIAATLGGVISGYIASKKSARFSGLIGQSILVVAVGILALFTEQLSEAMVYAIFIAIGLVEMYIITTATNLFRVLATSKHIATAVGTANFITWIFGASVVAQLWGMWIPKDFAMSGFKTALLFHFGLVIVGFICIFFVKEEPIKALAEDSNP